MPGGHDTAGDVDLSGVESHRRQSRAEHHVRAVPHQNSRCMASFMSRRSRRANGSLSTAKAGTAANLRHEFDQCHCPKATVVHEYGLVVAGIRKLPTTARCGCYAYMLKTPGRRRCYIPPVSSEEPRLRLVWKQRACSSHRKFTQSGASGATRLSRNGPHCCCRRRRPYRVVPILQTRKPGDWA